MGRSSATPLHGKVRNTTGHHCENGLKAMGNPRTGLKTGHYEEQLQRETKEGEVVSQF
jgi:hypothetical protein